MKIKLWKILVIIYIIVLAGLSCKKETLNNDCKSRFRYYSYNRAVPDTIKMTEIPNEGTISFYDTLSSDNLNQILNTYPDIKCLSSSSNGNWIKIGINSQSCPETELLFSQIKDDPRVSNCNKVLVDQEGNYIGILDRLICVLKKETSWDKVNELILNTNTTIIEYSANTRTLLLKADKNSSGDALDIANEFFESGYFVYAEPEFISTSYNN
jgi:hypothetical protein